MANSLNFNAANVPLLFHAGDGISFLMVYKIDGVAQPVAGISPVYTVSFNNCSVEVIATLENSMITVATSTSWQITIPASELVDVKAGAKGWHEMRFTEHERTYFHGEGIVQKK